MTTFFGDNNANTLNGTSGADIFHAYGGNDTINASQGGSDTVYADAGDDVINMGAALTPSDHIDGGSGYDTVRISGGASIAFTATTMVNVENLVMAAGSSYYLTMNDANVVAGGRLTIDAGALSAGRALTFDGTAETNGGFKVIGGAGNDYIEGGAGDDAIYIDHGGEDQVYAGGGNNIVYAGAALDAQDTIEGAGGYTTVVLQGDYSVAKTLFFTTETIVNVQQINVMPGYNYHLVLAQASIFGSGTLTVDGSGLLANNSLNFDASTSATGGRVDVTGGQGADIIKGTFENDVFRLEHGGVDNVLGGDGNDTFYLGGALTAADTLDGGAGTGDVLDLKGDYSAGLTFQGSTMTGFEVLLLEAGFDYKLTLGSPNIPNGQSLVVNGISLGVGDVLNFDASVGPVGNITVYGGFASDVVNTGMGADSIHFEKGGSDTAATRAGDDKFYFDTTFDATDRIDGGDGTDWVYLNGDYTGAHAVVMNANTMLNIEAIGFTAGHSYSLTLNDANLATGQTLVVYAPGLAAANSVTFNASAETDATVDFVTGAGNDVLSGGGGNDLFVLSAGGADIAKGGGGDDTFNMGAAFAFDDQIDGGAGNDTLSLSGNYSGLLGVFFNSTTLTNVETINLGVGYSYTLTTNDATVAAGQVLNVNAGSLGAANALNFNGVFETDGSFAIIGGAGNDVVTGGEGNDSFNLLLGGVDQAGGNGGDDLFIFNASLTAADQVDGGSGNDTVSIFGDHTGVHALVLVASTMTNVETFEIGDGYSYDITFNDGNVFAGKTLHVDGSLLETGQNLTINGAAELDGAYLMTAGGGDDVLTGGNGDDTFEGGEGNDTINGGNGANTASYAHSFFGVTVSLAVAGPQDTIGAGVDTLISIENLTGSDFADTLTAGPAGSVLNAGMGADTLVSGAGADTLNGAGGTDTASYANAAAAVAVSLAITAAQDTGGAGVDTLTSIERLTGSGFDDTLTGNNGTNLIFGGAGDDIINGAGGQDTLKGGTGNDTFVFSVPAASTNAAPDLIQDFSAGDHIDLHLIDANTAIAGDQAFHLGGGGGHAGDIVVSYDAVNNRTVLDLYVDANATIDSTIWLTGDHSAIAAGDFAL